MFWQVLITCDSNATAKEFHSGATSHPDFGFGLKASTSSSSPAATTTSLAVTILFSAFSGTSSPFAAVGVQTLPGDEEKRKMIEETNEESILSTTKQQDGEEKVPDSDDELGGHIEQHGHDDDDAGDFLSDSYDSHPGEGEEQSEEGESEEVTYPDPALTLLRQKHPELNQTLLPLPRLKIYARGMIYVGGYLTIPSEKDIPGASSGITSGGFFDLEEQPKRVVVVGPVELAGTHLIIRGETVLRTFDPTLQQVLMSWMEHTGVKIQKSTKVVQAIRISSSNVCWAISGHAAIQVVSLEKHGVDKYQNSSVKGIAAVGDVQGKALLTPSLSLGSEGFKDDGLGYENIPTVVFSFNRAYIIGMSSNEAMQGFNWNGNGGLKSNMSATLFNNTSYCSFTSSLKFISKLRSSFVTDNNLHILRELSMYIQKMDRPYVILHRL
ncbi:hypothetical protein F5877DRAFT_71684 [Lentinula edodes]|nr:hypothetical protein F5877DRAFT_71684 [Lentinula edodes]